METFALTVKLVMFYGLEVFVIAALGATLVLGIYQLIRQAIGRFSVDTQTVTSAVHKD
ncbi:MAG: hypothetical protein JXD18_14725 [Anaerolineae bacterium]|nr:hypothetical protein [Anaerolineae bacterium]